MKSNRLTAIAGIVAFVISGSSRLAPADDPNAEPLWPDGAPGCKEIEDKEKVAGRPTTRPDRFVSGVTRPTVTVYLPPEANATGAAVVICPGGGYGGLAIDKEGHDIARWLNSLGVAGIVLKYRMPRPELSKDQKPWPLQDVQRGIRLVRSRAAQLRVDPNRVGVMGFSAGGHLASTAGTHFDAGQSDSGDPIERQSCRPDFMILVYPVISLSDKIGHGGSRRNLLGDKPDEKLIQLYSNELQVTAQTPPTFLVHAKDDPVKVENSVLFHQALQQAKVPAEIQLYEKGGHGYGLGVRGGDVATWPARCAEWMKKLKLAGNR